MCSVCLALCATTRAAEPSQGALAEELFKRGRALLADGDVPAACEALAESQRLDPALGTLLNLAVCHERQGHLASAWTEFLQAKSEAQVEGQLERARYAEGKAAALEPRIQKLHLTVPQTMRDLSDLQIRLDDEELGRAAWDGAIPLDPGTHHIAAHAAAHQPWQQQFEIAEGQPPLQLQLPELAPLQPPPAAAPTAKPAPVEPANSRTPTAQWVGLGLSGAGVVSFGVAGYFGLRALGYKNDRDPYCDHDNVCTPRGVSFDGKARDAAVAANVAAVLGAVLVGSGVTLLLLAPDDSGSGSLSAGLHATTTDTQLQLAGQF